MGREQPSKVSGNSQTLGFGDRRMTFLPLPAGEGRDEGKWPIGSFQRTYWKTVAGDCKFLSLSICFLLFINPALHARSNADADPLPALVQVLHESSDTQMQLDILRGLSAAFKGRRQVPMPKGWGPVETKLSQSQSTEVRTLTQSLSLTFGSAQALAALRRILADPGANLNARRTALDSLLGAKDSGLTEILFGLLKDPDLRGAAIRGLAAYNDPKTPEAILTVFSSFDGAEKRDALNTLSSRVAFAKPMIASVEADKIPRNALTAEIIRQLRNLKNADIDAQLQKVYGTIRESSADKKREMERYKQIYWAGGSQPGDAPRGRAVFAQYAALDQSGQVRF